MAAGSTWVQVLRRCPALLSEVVLGRRAVQSKLPDASPQGWATTWFSSFFFFFLLVLLPIRRSARDAPICLARPPQTARPPSATESTVTAFEPGKELAGLGVARRAPQPLAGQSPPSSTLE